MNGIITERKVIINDAIMQKLKKEYFSLFFIIRLLSMMLFSTT